MLCSEVFSLKGEPDLDKQGRYVVAIIASNKVTVKQILPNAQLSTESILDVPYQVTNVSISPDSQYVLVWSSKQNLASVLDTRGNLVSNIEEGLGIVNCFWAPDSKQILLLTPFKLSVYDLSTGANCWFRSPKNLQKGCVFSQCGKYMALCERRQCKDYVGLYFVKGWKLLNYFPLLEMMDLAGVEWAPNNCFLVAWDTHLNYKLVPICLMNGPLPKFCPYEYALGIKEVVYSHNSLLVGIGSYDQKIRLLNAMTWRLIGELECPSTITPSATEQIACYKQKDRQRESLSSKTASSLSELQPVFGNFKIPSIKVVQQDKQNLKQGIRLMEFSPTDQFIAGKNDNMPQALWIWSTRTLQLVSVIQFSADIKHFQWSPEKDIICICAGTSSRIFFWSPVRMICAQLPFANNPIQPLKLKWTKDGRNIVLSDRANATLVQVQDGLINKLIYPQ